MSVIEYYYLKSLLRPLLKISIMALWPSMKILELFPQKTVLKHKGGVRLAIFEIVIYKVPVSTYCPEVVKELRTEVKAMIDKVVHIYEK